MWSDAVEEVFEGDEAVALAYVTPAKGVVLAPVTNFAIHDRDARTMVVNSSIGAWKKLERMRRNPRVAVAFHTRAHSRTDRREYVLVQGIASFPWPPDHDSWMEPIRANWDARGPIPRDVGPLWEWWMSVYHWRVNVTIALERVLVWPDLACRGASEVQGAPLPAEPPPAQRPPMNGTGPRVSHRRAAWHARRLPDVLLGWVGADGFPVVVPVEGAAAVREGIELALPGGVGAPPGGRRAGLTSHWFAKGVVGQEQHIHTGWLEVDTAGRALYAPHTNASYLLPPSKTLYKLATGGATRLALRRGRRAGVLPG